MTDRSHFRFLSRCRIRLPREEEARLARAMHRGDEQARQRLIESQLPYVLTLARGFIRPGLPVEDLYQIGVVAFLHALPQYDPRLSRLGTWIRDPIVWALLSFTKKKRTVVHRPNKPCPGAERDYAAAARPVSIEQSIKRDGTAQIADLLHARERDLDREIDFANARRRLDAAIGRLPPKMGRVIRDRLAGRLLREIALDLDLSRERIRQIEEAAIERLRRDLDPRPAAQ